MQSLFACESLIGTGASGAVYKARWGVQSVAAKTFFYSQSDLYERAIQKEISLLQRLRHRHIIQFFKTHEEDGQIYLLMDLAENGSLATAINTKSGGGQDLLLDWPTKIRLTHEIALGLEYIHHEGVLHRDLKSDNVLLTRHMEVKLADFGLAQVRQSMSTGASMSNSSAGGVGTVRWMAPELFLEKPKYSSKSDMYALGMVMWEMAANCTKPFQDQPNDFAVPALVIRDGRREVLPDDTPAQYRELVEQCWHKVPAYRPDASKAAHMMHDEPTVEGRTVDEDCSATSISLNTIGPTVGQGRDCNDAETAIHTLAIAENQQSGHVGRLPQTKDIIVSFFCMRAQQGNLDAQLFLGWVYSNGWGGVDKCVEDSLCWYRKAAESGNATAQLTLARTYEKGQVVEPSDVEALTWYRKAADCGDAEAQFSVGRFYDYGRGVKEDVDYAAQWYRRAADQGHVDAQVKMGSWCSLGLGVETSDVEAANWYRKAAEQGEAGAQSLLGSVYASGIGVKKNDILAARWYKKAAAQSDALAMFNLGCFYYHGRGVEQSYVEALAWHRMATAHGNKMSPRNIGYMYQTGQAVERSTVEAFRWYLVAAERGDVQAQLLVSDAFYVGQGVKKNTAEAFKWCRKAAEQSDANAQVLLGLMYQQEQNDAEAVIWYRKAAEQGNAQAQRILEYTFGEGRESE